MKLIFFFLALLCGQLVALQPPQQPRTRTKMLLSGEDSLRTDDCQRCEECCLWISKTLCITTVAVIANNNLNRHSSMNESVFCLDFAKLNLSRPEQGLAVAALVGSVVCHVIGGELRQRNKKREKLRSVRHDQRLVELIYNAKKNN